MKIIGELPLEVDNEVYCGKCRLLVLDEYPPLLEENCFRKMRVLIGGQEHEIFPVMSHYKEGDIEGDELSVYLLADPEETLLEQIVAFVEEGEKA